MANAELTIPASVITSALRGDRAPAAAWGKENGFELGSSEKVLEFIGRVESESKARIKRQSFGWKLSTAAFDPQAYEKVFAELSQFLGYEVREMRKQRTA
jgi:hypothetical protein